MTISSVVLNSSSESWAPMEKNSPAMDQDDKAARHASKVAQPR